MNIIPPTIPGCMIYGSVEPDVIEQPDSIYEKNIEYKCLRCGHSFSERHPTAKFNVERCPFDD